MAINQLRAHVRHFLYAATVAVVQLELDLMIEEGNAGGVDCAERAGYIEEYLCELRAEKVAVVCGRDWSECVGCPESGVCADEN
jgi:hypothetical protein